MDTHIESRRRSVIAASTNRGLSQGFDLHSARRRAVLIEEIYDATTERYLTLDRAIRDAGRGPDTWSDILSGQMPEIEIVALRDRVRDLPRVSLDEITQWALRG